MASNELAQALKNAKGGGGTKINRAGRQIHKAGWGLHEVLHPQKLTAAQLAQGPPGLTEQVSQIIESAPAGVVHFAKGVATDPLAAAGAGALIGGAASAETGPGALIGAGIGAGVGLAGYGIRRLLDENADPFETSGAMLDSFQRTGGRLIHPSRYGKASDEGNLVASIVEDVANLSMVASAGAKGISAATGGAAEEAAAARAAASSYTSAAQKEAQQVAALTKEATTPGVSPALAAAKMKLAQHLAGSVDAWTAQAEQATAKAAQAEAAAGPLLGPYKVVKKASTLGARGANLPAEVYTGSARLIGKAFKEIGVRATPKLEAALASSDIGTEIVASLAKMRGQVEAMKQRFDLRSQVSDEIHAGAMRAIQEAEPYRRLRDAWMKDVPEPIEQQVGLIVATGIPEQLARLHDDVGPDVVEHVIHFATQRNGDFFGASPEALKLALEYTQGRIADAELAGRLNASEQYARELITPIEKGYVEDLRGLPPEQTVGEAGDAVRAQRRWQVEGDTPNEVAMARAQKAREVTMDAAGKRLGESRAVLERATGRLQFTPDQLRAPVKATRLDVETAMRIGGQFVQEHPELAAQLFPEGVHGPLHMQRLVADAVLQARNAGVVDQLPAELAQMIEAGDFSGERSLVAKLAPAEKLIRQGRKEGAADTAQQLADRLTQMAEDARARGDKAGAALAEARSKLPKTSLAKVVRAAERVQRAVDRVNRAKARAERLGAPEAERIVARAQRGLEKEVHAQRSVARKAMYEASNDELHALAQDMGGWFPSSHPKWLHRVSRGDLANVRHPSIDHWNQLIGNSEMPSLVTRPPQVIRGGYKATDLDVLIDNYRRNMPGLEDASSSEVMEAILSRLNGAAQHRLLANGIVGKGIRDLRQAETVMSMMGYGKHDIENMLPMFQHGTPKEVAAELFDRSQVSPITEASAAKVMDAVEARIQAEQEGIRGQIPNRYLTDEAAGTPRPQPVSAPIPEGTLTPFEQALADRVFAQAKKVAAERNEPRVSRAILTRIVDEAASKGMAAGRAQGAEAAATRGAGIAQGVADQATVAAQRGNESAVASGVGTLGGRAFGTGVTAGKQARDVAVALRDVGVKERTYERLDARTQEQVQAAADSRRNAPARYKPLLAFNEQAQKGIEDFIAEQLEPEVGPHLTGDAAEQLRAFAADIPVTLAAAVDEGFNPRYTIGGRVDELGPSSSRPNNNGRLPRTRKGSETYERTANAGPRSAEEAVQLAVERTTTWVRNETAYRLQARFGVAPTSVIGIRPEDAGFDTSELRAAPDAETAKAALQALRDQAKEQGLAVVQGEGANVLLVPGHMRSGLGLAEAMEEAGYVAWNPASMFDTVPKKDVTLATTFVPKAMFSRFKNQIGEASQIEQAFRKFYDKPMRVWKDQVLALSPRWHVNNIIGGMVTATAGGGINPLTYGRNFVRSVKILRAMHDDGRLAKLQESDPEGAQIALNMDPRIHQGTEGSALETAASLDEGAVLPKRARTKLARGYKAATGKSYAFNGFVDDANRLAVFLTEQDRMTNAQIAEWVQRNPDLGYSFDKGKPGIEGIRDELAVRQSLKVVGDFTRLTPFERQFARRVLPFYPWMRHITKLALRMPVTAPVRVAWLMHLAEMFGEPPAFPFLKGYIPIGAEQPDQSRQYLHVGNVNPFSDIAYGSQGTSDFSLSDIPGGVLGNVSPAISTAAAVGLGLDLRTGQQLTRPAGTYNLDPYGRDSRTPLLGFSRWGEAAGYMRNLLPMNRVGVAALDGLEYGGKLPLRYPTGQLMKSQGQDIFSDRPWYGPAVDLLGIPITGPEKIGLAELRGRRDERVRRAAASRRRYAGATSSSSGGALPAWGSKG